jgi:hypothetical protein
MFCYKLKVIGKFGASTKLSNVITIEPKDNQISSDSSVLLNTSSKTSRISSDFRQLAFYSLPEEVRRSMNKSESAQEINLENVVDVTHDLCFNLMDETESFFKVHKVFDD